MKLPKFMHVSIQTPHQLRPLGPCNFVISCEPVKVETESRNFSRHGVYKIVHDTGIPVPKFWLKCKGTSPF